MQGSRVLGVLVLSTVLWSEAQGSIEPQTLAIQTELFQNKTSLKQLLAEGYRNDIPPMGGAEVELQFVLYQMVEINTPKQSVTMQGWWRHYWTDTRLSWSQDIWGIPQLIYKFSDLWTPDDLIYEIIGQDVTQVAEIIVYPSGLCFFSQPKVTTSSCTMKLDPFPFDTQTCVFTVGSMSYDGTELDLVPRGVSPDRFDEREDGRYQPKLGVDLDQYIPLQEFALTRVRVTTMNFFYDCCPAPYPILIYEFEIARQPWTYVSGIIIPLMIVTVVGFSALLMPAPISGSRPGLSVSVMFTTSAIYLVASSKLPEVSDSTLIGRMYLVSLTCSLINTLISILTTSMNQCITEEKSNKSDMLAQFRFWDTDKTGELDFMQAKEALGSIGLNQQERDSVLRDLNVQPDDRITLDGWLELATIARRYRPTTQYNVFIGTILELINGRFHKQVDLHNDQALNYRGTQHVELDMLYTKPSNLPDPGASFVPEDNGRNGNSTSNTHLDFRILQWLNKIEAPMEVFDSFRDQKVDVTCLALMTKADMIQLGITALGDQTNILHWAQEEQRTRKRKVNLDHRSELEVAKSFRDQGSLPTPRSQQSNDSPRSPEEARALALNVGSTNGNKHNHFLDHDIHSFGHIKKDRPHDNFNRLSSTHFQDHSKRIKSKIPSKGSKIPGAMVDYYAAIIFPALFVIYVVVECAGGITGSAVYGKAPNGKTKIELIDQRAPEGQQCYSNTFRDKVPSVPFCADFGK